MHVIICGAGEVGRHTAEVLGEHGHSVTMIDTSSAALRRFDELADVHSLQGSACHAATLRDASVEKCDLLVAATDQDEINLVIGAVAKGMGAGRVIARIHHRAYIDKSLIDYAELLQIDHVICPEFLTAQVIARNLRSPGAMVIERFAKDKIEMQQYVVKEGSAALGVKLRDLELPPGVRIATIEQGDRASMPGPASVLEVGDAVTVIAEARHAERLRKLFLQDKQATTRVVIMGGTSLAVWLSRELKSRLFSVRVFENDRARAEELSAKLEHVTLIEGDPTDPVLSHEEHLENCDAFVAVSKDDEHNIIGALQAKEFGARMVVVVIAQPRYLPLLERIGIDRPYSARIVAAKEVLRLIDDAPVRRVATLAKGIADVYELDPANHGTAVGKSLKAVKLPKGALVVAVQRLERVFVPVADDIITAGDVVVVIGPQKIEKKLRELFIGK